MNLHIPSVVSSDSIFLYCLSMLYLLVLHHREIYYNESQKVFSYFIFFISLFDLEELFIDMYLYEVSITSQIQRNLPSLPFFYFVFPPPPVVLYYTVYYYFFCCEYHLQEIMHSIIIFTIVFACLVLTSNAQQCNTTTYPYTFNQTTNLKVCMI